MFIINPISGIGKKNIIPSLVEKKLDKRRFDWQFEFTERRYHGEEIANRNKDKFDAIIAVGGDGSVNEIGSALINSECALGIIPCGSGNGIARHLNIVLNIEKALERINDFKPVKIDTGLLNNKVFIGTCGFGYDAHIAHEFDNFGKRGFLSYIKLVLREYKKYSPPIFEIKGTDLTIDQQAFMCCIANSSEFGNGFKIAPNSDMSDGIFELIFLKELKWYAIPTVAMRFFNGKIDRSKSYSIYSFKDKIELTTKASSKIKCHLDGEPFLYDGGITVQIQSKSLTVL